MSANSLTEDEIDGFHVHYVISTDNTVLYIVVQGETVSVTKARNECYAFINKNGISPKTIVVRIIYGLRDVDQIINVKNVVKQLDCNDVQYGEPMEIVCVDRTQTGQSWFEERCGRAVSMVTSKWEPIGSRKTVYPYLISVNDTTITIRYNHGQKMGNYTLDENSARRSAIDFANVNNFTPNCITVEVTQPFIEVQCVALH